MKLYHLSHTDLDGYGCQMVTKEYFKDVNFYNANYGKEIDERIEEIFKDIQKDEFDKHLILITDLNLTLDQAKLLEEKRKEHKKDIDLLLLDHHKTSLECANKYEWYYLDTSRSATKITYEYFCENYEKKDELLFFVNVVNAIDIWLKNDKDFELGKVCMRLVSSAKEINRVLFAKENSSYIFHILKNAQNFFSCKNPHIELDNNLHQIKKSFFKNDKANDDTLDNLVSKYIVNLLGSKKEQMSISYDNFKGILTYNIGNVSVVGNDFLEKNPDFDFFMDVTNRKTISLRANGKVDVSTIAKKLANGGGHPNASGIMLNSFKESILYENVKIQIEEIIKRSKNGN